MRPVESPCRHSWHQRLLPRPTLTLLVLLLWLSVTNAATLGLLVLGMIVAIVIPLLTQSFWREAVHPLHWRPAVRFMAVFVYDIVVANWGVARRVIAPPERLTPAIVDIPLDLRDPFVATLLASIVSLTPGTLSIDVDRQKWILRVHALDAPEPERLVVEVKTRYESALKEIFAC